MSHQNREDIITIIYKTEGKNKIQIFSDDFVKNNKDKCKIVYKDKESELTSFLKVDKEDINKDLCIIKLRGINNITDTSYMFYGCYLLISLPDISKWNTSNIIAAFYLFSALTQ